MCVVYGCALGQIVMGPSVRRVLEAVLVFFQWLDTVYASILSGLAGKRQEDPVLIGTNVIGERQSSSGSCHALLAAMFR